MKRHTGFLAFIPAVLFFGWTAASPASAQTSTYTFTRTSTPTPTFTRSFTPTPTLTGSGGFPGTTLTVTRTSTFTVTRTRTNTPTPTGGFPVSITLTWTPTPSFTPVNTSTFTITPTDTNTPLAVQTCAVAENFEDGDLYTPFGGSWSAIYWGNAASSIAISPTGASGTAYSLRATGWNATASDGWGVRGDLNAGLTPVDLNALYAGISFYVRVNNPGTYRLRLASSVDTGEGWGASFTANTSWEQVIIPRASMSPGAGETALLDEALAATQSFLWSSVGGPTGTTLEIDQICVMSYAAYPTPTSGPTTFIWRVPETDVATAIGCTPQVVNEVRSLQLDDFMSYLIMRITVNCGCTVTHIMGLRRNMAWDDIVIYYGLDWQTLVDDVLTRMATLPREGVPPTYWTRGAANNTNDVPAIVPRRPVPAGQVVFLPPVTQEVCP